MKLSLVIPAKDKNDPKLAELLKSIESQDFDKTQMETLIITQGTSESAKAIGIRKAKGEVIGILASDNELVSKSFLTESLRNFPVVDASYPIYYYYCANDDCLNRYFALIGGNDPLAYYMGKNDKFSYIQDAPKKWHRYFGNQKTIGDNGFFIKKELIEATDLDNYYHIDNAIEATPPSTTINQLEMSIWHKTGGNLFNFLKKRYRYGLQHAFNSNRRWHLVDFRERGDVLRLIWFILASVTFIHPLILAIRGYCKIRDIAWFVHPIMCFLTVVTYGILVCHLALRRLYQLLFVPTVEVRA